MKKTILFCGVPVDVTLSLISEKEVPYYIRERLGNTNSYIQKKRASGINWYFYKATSNDCVTTFYMGELPIDDSKSGNTNIA